VIAVMTVAEALRRPRFLISLWPWRTLAYAITSVPVAGVLACGVYGFLAPLYASVNSVVHYGGPLPTHTIVLALLGGAVIVGLAPLVGAPVAAVERQRLRIVDPRPLPAPRFASLGARYATAAGWRQAGYAFWLGGVVPLAYAIFVLLLSIDVSLIMGVWVTRSADDVVMVWSTVDTPAQAAPYAVAGVLLIPVLAYLLGLLVAVQSAVARRLLGPGGNGRALTEVAQSRARLVDSYESERRRIERDVHDAAQPRLTSLSLQLGLAQLDVPEDSPAAAPLAAAHDQAKSLMVLLRQIVQGIRPQSLTDLGLAGAVRELAEQATVPVTVSTALTRPVPELVETTAYYVVSEALANVVRHSGATRSQVRLSHLDGALLVEVTDDGRGGADPDRGTGLTGLADRVAAVNGRLLLSSPAGGPTVLRVELPC
jgi:signal transduction histidine kinase